MATGTNMRGGWTRVTGSTITAIGAKIMEETRGRERVQYGDWDGQDARAAPSRC